MFQNLGPQLESVLPRAVNVYIATALVKRAGYQTIEKLLHCNCKRYYLIGTSLPSDASVFQAMLETSETRGKTKVYLGNYTFHPKMYLVELASGDFTAFIGSANTTYGGLNTNVEMSIQTNDQHLCIELYDWFQNLFVNAGELTGTFVDAWRKRMQQINKRQAATRSDMDGLKQYLTIPHKTIKANLPQFFRHIDYQAYQESNWMNYSNAVNLERKSVWERFKQLDRIIYNKFNNYGLTELFAHYHPASRVSHYQYRKGYTNPRQRSMWLHYGYGRSDFPKGDNFGNHPRIQIILHHDDVGIWLVAGVNNGSRKERDGFRKNLLLTPFFDELVYNLVNELGESYWLSVNSKLRGVGSFTDVDSLKQYLLKDDNSDYLIFGRTFKPNDESLAESVISETILNEFQRLYDLYLLFRKNK
jgi:hypothetical protein